MHEGITDFPIPAAGSDSFPNNHFRSLKQEH